MHRSFSLRLPAFAALALLTAALSACEQQPTSETSENIVQPPLAERPALPVSDPALDREAVLLATLFAASAQATGVNDLQKQRQLDGRQIEVRIRLGCEGQSSETNASGWSFDAETRRLRIRALPNLSLEDPVIRQLFGEGAEEVEGFWLPRPWLLTAACPRALALAPAQPEAKSVATPTNNAVEGQDKQLRTPAALAMRTVRVGIAQIFTETDDRARRRSGRAYESTNEVPEGQQPGSQGFNLVLSGRLRAHRAGRVIHCGGGSGDAPPDCIVSADIDRVWIENPDDQTVVAEWRS